jgi:hypothetical protein
VEPCSVDGCSRKRKSELYCSPHHKRVKKYGDPGPADIRARRTPIPVGTPCSVDGCDRPNRSKGYCNLHYDRLLTRGYVGEADLERKPSGRPCSVDGCPNVVDAREMCGTHYRRWQLYGDPLLYAPPPEHGGTCMLDGCSNKHHAHGYCGEHSARWRKYGDPTFSPRPQYEDTCMVDGCGLDRAAWGYCFKHGARYHRHGDPTVVHRTGYENTDPGVVYLIANDERMKIGIANDFDQRAANHHWHTEIVDILHVTMGEAQRIERVVKEALKESGIPTGKAAWGRKFDGYTETWHREHMDASSIGDLLAALSIAAPEAFAAAS